MIKLRVWANAQPVGWLGHAAAQYFFQYDVQWIQDTAAFALAPQFALREAPYRMGVVIETNSQAALSMSMP